MTVNKATSWAPRSHRTLRAGPSQELRRESHQFRSDLCQDFQLKISRTLLRTARHGAQSQQFRPYSTVGPGAVHRSTASPGPSFGAKSDASAVSRASLPAPSGAVQEPSGLELREVSIVCDPASTHVR